MTMCNLQGSSKFCTCAKPQLRALHYIRAAIRSKATRRKSRR